MTVVLGKPGWLTPDQVGALSRERFFAYPFVEWDAQSRPTAPSR